MHILPERRTPTEILQTIAASVRGLSPPQAAQEAWLLNIKPWESESQITPPKRAFSTKKRHLPAIQTLG
jgi:hypothetical protein